MTSVRNKTVIVTGGANGIGYHCCQQLLLNGAKYVAILDLSDSNGEKSVETLNKENTGKRAFFFPADVTKHEEFEVAFKKATTAMGGLDILINNAGILNDHIWEKEIAVNLTGLVKNTLLAYDVMGKHKGGKGGIIVNVASIVGLVPLVIAPVYTATKHAVIGLSLSLKAHYNKTGVSIRVLCPGFTETPLITEAENKYLSFIDKEDAAKQMLGHPRQPIENVGKAAVQLIEKGTNGAVWVSQTSDPPLEIHVEQYKSIKM